MFPHGPMSSWGRVAAVADALGTTVARLVGGLAVAVVLAVVVGWTLLSAPGGAAGDEALPRAPVTTAPTGPASSAVFVYVAGAVVSPGVYRVPADARVADVLDAAGGPAPGADLVVLNLAATVTDGERIYVPRQGEQVPPEVAASGPNAGPGQPSAPVNLNTATVDQLDDLPGVGPATAQAIVAWRRQHGRFKRVDDLLNVRGIGPAKLDALRGQVRV